VGSPLFSPSLSGDDPRRGCRSPPHFAKASLGERGVLPSSLLNPVREVVHYDVEKLIFSLFLPPPFFFSRLPFPRHEERALK